MSDPVTIVLHIGRGKTGTTSLQSLFSARRTELARLGIHYPAAGEYGGGHQVLAKSILEEIPEWMAIEPGLQDIQDHVRKEIATVNSPIILFSSENFTMTNPDLLASFIRSLRKDATVKVIFYARSQDELAESQYNQDVKWSRETRTFSEYVETGGCTELHFDELLAPWKRAFGREAILAGIYDARHSIIDDFFGKLRTVKGANWSLHEPAFAPQAGVWNFANASLGRIAMETFRQCNENSIPGHHALYAQLNDFYAPFDMPAIFFSSDRAREFRSRFASSNLRFSEEYLGKPLADLGGRRYSDDERDTIITAIGEMMHRRDDDGRVHPATD